MSNIVAGEIYIPNAEARERGKVVQGSNVNIRLTSLADFEQVRTFCYFSRILVAGEYSKQAIAAGFLK